MHYVQDKHVLATLKLDLIAVRQYYSNAFVDNRANKPLEVLHLQENVSL